jgi:class 3 adenylate cyclase
MSGATHFRGHLFADLRGSTAFTEREGNAAGAELVRRFRQMVRDEVANHQGAEVKTEGDAVYVVFPSASTAVMCGLALIDCAAELTAQDPKLPMHIGVGVHAGEAIEVAEGGYIGTAVNLAARVCAVAAAGEVLVTGTVRGIAAASIPVTFVARGRRRLKGISEPVELYRVVPAGVVVPSARRISRGIAAAAGAALVLILVAGLGFVFIMSPRSPAATPSLVAAASTTPAPLVTPRTTPTALPTASRTVPRVGALDIGEFRAGEFQPEFAFDVVDQGWSLTGDAPQIVSWLYEPDPGGTIDVGRISTTYTNPCVPGGPDDPVINSAAQLMAALQTESFVHMSDPAPIVVNHETGLSSEISVGPEVFIACDPGTAGVPVFPLGGSDYVIQTGQLFKLIALDVEGSNVAFVVASKAGPNVSVSELENFFRVAQRMIETINF